ncbi:TetR/AcrR family transcriptional regulator [Nannocystis pusilla]|uniref:TetR/AcrR family transcriptional regulator n=1 Tax=Nannocystis pusilla TaxID=889268 RepID=UPI003DA1F046
MLPDDPARARILDAAQTLLDLRAGPLRLANVAVRAGLSRASLYRRFADRQALLDALQAERGVAAGEPGLDLRRTILAGAREAFNASGLGGATMDNVAARAGVGVASVYRHFEDKAGLLRALLAEFEIDTLAGQLEAASSAPLEAFLRLAARGIIAFFLDNRFALVMVVDPSDATREIVASARETSALRLTPTLTAALAERLRAGEIVADEDPRELAVALVGLCIAAVALTPATADDPDAAARRVARRFARAIARRAPVTATARSAT